MPENQNGSVLSPDELAVKIEQYLLRSGFPLELHVLNICSTKNTGRLPSVRYEYLDQQREIDLVAFFEAIDFRSRGKKIPQHTSTDLIIE